MYLAASFLLLLTLHVCIQNPATELSKLGL
jgi:hypothetical protein